MSRKFHTYTDEQIDYIKSIAPVNRLDDIVSKFNEKFNLNLSKRAIQGLMYRQRIPTGIKTNSGQFKKGHTPWSKGKKGLTLGNKETWFGKGKDHNKYLPIGSEVVENTGYTLVKIGDPDKWGRKHYLEYEKHHGEVPEDKLVIFADNDKSNFDKDNLILVSRGQLRRLSHQGLRFDDAELTKVGLNIVKVHEAIVNKEVNYEKKR